MKPHLKLYPAPTPGEIDPITEAEQPTPPGVHVRLRDLLPLVAMAQKFHFVWLRDFLDDEVCISEDLNDVLSTFRGHRPAG